LVTLYLVCVSDFFPTEERYSPVILSYHCSQWHCGGVCVYLKGLREIRISQDYVFCDRSLNIVKCLLMDRISPPRFLFGFILFGGFHFPALSHKICERGQHFTTLRSHVTVLLDHSKESSQLTDCLGWIYCKDRLYLFLLRFYSTPCEDIA